MGSLCVRRDLKASRRECKPNNPIKSLFPFGTAFPSAIKVVGILQQRCFLSLNDGNTGDLLDQFFQHCCGKILIIRRCHHKGAGAADHIVAVIAVDRRILVQNGQTVNGNPRIDDLVADAVPDRVPWFVAPVARSHR